MHALAFRFHVPAVEPFRLTVEKIERVSALFKAGSYLSFDNYIGRAKAEHFTVVKDSGVDPWPLDLSRAYTEGIRSVGRNSGTSRQSLPVDPVRIILIKA